MKSIKEELVTINSETPCLSEATEVINEISVKIPLQLLISKIPASFDENFDHLIMNNIIEAENFEPERTFENTINEIKYNHLKIITFIAIKILAITANKPYSSYEHLKSNLMPCILLISPLKSLQFTKHLS